MSVSRIIKLGDRRPGARSCRAVPGSGKCSCGWTATSSEKAAATMDHLYGDLTDATRQFAYEGFPARQETTP
jgi:hypothetical protein